MLETLKLLKSYQREQIIEEDEYYDLILTSKIVPERSQYNCEFHYSCYSLMIIRPVLR